ncbi:hypothetical protein CC207_00440 [Pseudomonas sp. DrBHI1]|nr:hypothetical protein A9L43_03075 [Pseudomonas mosselii]OWQ38077.1 hypothetical protein CC207_00440 [Pseudomonas sp. DrBHI1]
MCGHLLVLEMGAVAAALWERACPAMPVRTASGIAWSGLIAGQARSHNAVMSAVDVNVNLPSGTVNRNVTFT